MPKFVILGSCRFEPYEILAVPKKNEFYNTEKGYKMATERFYPAIDEADIVIVYAPDGVGEHTGKDLEYVKSKGKRVVMIKGVSD